MQRPRYNTEMTVGIESMLGRTFSELHLDAEGASRHALRERYRLALTGPAPLPISRRIQDGGVTKFAQRRPDGLEIESVIIPMWRAGSRWTTLCVSSQVGCAMGCTFCETAQLGRLADLSAAEIVGQVVAARHEFGGDVRNVVFMGMGEPMDNFENVIQAVRVLTDPMGLSMGMGRITISTVGRIDGIRKLAGLGWRRINLAVSLNAPNDEIRSQIMPINRAEPMAALREALLAYPLRSCQFFMIEYVLIPGVNDAPAHARELAEFLRPVKCCVNVIPYNPRLNSPWPAPTEDQVVGFLTTLQDAGQFCKRRITKGRDFMAACGQLGNRALSPRNRLASPPDQSDTSRPMLANSIQPL